MTRAVRGLVALGVVATLCACASAKLQVDVDLYKRDPRQVAPLIPEQVKSLDVALDKLVGAAERNIADRIKLANQVFDVFRSVWILIMGSDRSLGTLRGQVAAHNEVLAARLPGLRTLVATAKGTVSAYLAIREPAPGEAATESLFEDPREREERLRAAEDAMLAAIAAARDSYAVAVAPAGADFDAAKWGYRAQENLELNTAQLEERAKRKPETAAAERAALDQNATRLYETMRGLKETYPNLAVPVAPVPAALQVAVNNAMREAEVAAKQLENFPETPKGKTADAELSASNRRLSQIDRIQDPGDPIWRLVTDPVNEHHWNTEFSQTAFYAEGNTAVVVVRDDPMNFRVQHSSNNPVALVKGQLEVTRAVASAAITVAAAASGVPPGALSALTGSGESQSVTPAPDTTLQGSQDVARRGALAEATAFHRAARLSSLERTLRFELTALAGMKAGTPEYQKTVERIKAALQGHATRFAPPLPKTEP